MDDVDGANSPSTHLADEGTAVLGRHDELCLLLVEDDDGDALLVEELIEDGDLVVDLVRAHSLDAALDIIARRVVHCILLDLGLPDSVGLGAVERIRATPCPPALVVLTGLTGTDDGVRALAAGADDYLVKGEVAADLLGRSVRYAVQRRRSVDQQREIFRSQLRAAETTRLERALLPRPLVHDEDLSVLVGYVPGGNGLLGGDFYDAVERPDGSVVCVVGDVAGHGPDEAALGATLRTAWRTLVVTGTDPSAVIGLVEQVLVLERARSEVFATLCQVVIAADRSSAEVYIAGHLAPLLVSGSECSEVPTTRRGRAIGVPVVGGWSPVVVPLAPSWALMLYTDGIVEATVAGAEPEATEVPSVRRRRRVGVEGLRAVVDAGLAAGSSALVERTLVEVRRLHGGPLVDDAAVLMIGGGNLGAGERGALLADADGWSR